MMSTRVEWRPTRALIQAHAAVLLLLLLLLLVVLTGCDRPRDESPPPLEPAAPSSDEFLSRRRAAVAPLARSGDPANELAASVAADDARRALASLCALGDARSCLHFARLEPVRRASDAVVAARAATLEAACQAGSGFDCYLRARLDDDDGGRPRDGERAFAGYQRACELGVLPGCARAAVFYEVSAPRSAPDADARAVELYLRACEGGFPEACADAARVWHTARKGLEPDPERARALLQQACAQGLASACVEPALRAWHDHFDCTGCDSPEYHHPQCFRCVAAEDRWKYCTGCPDEPPFTAAELAALKQTRARLRAELVAALARALELELQLCADGLLGGCSAAAGYLRHDALEASERSAALARLEGGCDEGDAAACTVVGLARIDRETDRELDGEIDRTRLEQGCTLGLEPACALVEHLDAATRRESNPGSPR